MPRSAHKALPLPMDGEKLVVKPLPACKLVKPHHIDEVGKYAYLDRRRNGRLEVRFKSANAQLQVLQ